MNKDHPVTRRELDSALATFKAEFKTALTDELTGMMRNIETSMLTAFHSYARGNAAPLGAIDAKDRELLIRMDELENRVLALETRR